MRPRPIHNKKFLVIKIELVDTNLIRSDLTLIYFGSGLVGYLVYPDLLTTLSKSLIESDWVGSRIFVNRAGLGPSSAKKLDQNPDNESDRLADVVIRGRVARSSRGDRASKHEC